MACVYIVVGKIASGKTTWACEFDEEKSIVLSHDELMLYLSDDCEGRAAHVDRANRISKYFASVCKDLVKLDISPILDYGFWTRGERDLLKEELTKYGIPYKLMYIKCEENKRIERLEKRNQSLSSSQQREYIIPPTLRERLDGFFEEPSEDENAVVVISE